MAIYVGLLIYVYFTILVIRLYTNSQPKFDINLNLKSKLDIHLANIIIFRCFYSRTLLIQHRLFRFLQTDMFYPTHPYTGRC